MRSNSSLSEYFKDINSGPYTDVPEKTLIEKYHTAIDLLVARWTALPRKPLAIYQIGQIGAPGISDLDFVIVFSDAAPIDWAQYQPQAFPDWVQQLLTHPPYFCTIKSWPDLPAWFPLFDLRHLWGEELKTPELPEKFLKGVSFGMLVDYLLIKIPVDLVWISWNKPLRLRILLAMLHSLKYTFRLAEQSGILVPDDVKTISGKVDTLRKTWFEADQRTQNIPLAEACAEGCKAAAEIIMLANEAINAATQGRYLHLLRQPAPNDTDLFQTIHSWDFNEAMFNSHEHYLRSGRVIWQNPRSFMHVLAVYASESTEFKKYLNSKGFKFKSNWDGGIWGEGLRYHTRAMLAYSESTAKLGVPPQKYVALGYSQPSPLFKTIPSHFFRLLKNYMHD